MDIFFRRSIPCSGTANYSFSSRFSTRLKKDLSALCEASSAPKLAACTKSNAARIGILSQIDTAAADATVGDVVIGNREKHEWASDPQIREIFTGLFGGFDDHLFERVFSLGHLTFGIVINSGAEEFE
mgnify:CR=1 FL=1